MKQVMNKKKKSAKHSIVVCVSGRGRSLENLLLRASQHSYEVVGVVSSHKECGGVSLAEKHKLAVFVGEFPKHAECSKKPPQKASQGEKKLAAFLSECGTELVVLAGFVRPFPVSVLGKLQALNIHPSLLPRFGGPGYWGSRVHKAVLESGDLVSGASCHLVTEEYDLGEILSQVVVSVEEEDTAEELSERIFHWEKQLLPHSIDLYFQRRASKKEGGEF